MLAIAQGGSQFDQIPGAGRSEQEPCLQPLCLAHKPPGKQ
jgi:hypothetical protein